MLTGFLLHHFLDDLLAAQNGAFQICVQDLLDIGYSGTEEEGILSNAGRINEDINISLK